MRFTQAARDIVSKTEATTPDTHAVRHALGDPPTETNWTGLETAPETGPDGGDAARLSVPGTATFRYQSDEEETGWDAGHGRFSRFDPAGVWWDWPLLALDVRVLDGSNTVDLTVSLLTPDGRDEDVLRDVTVSVNGDGWQTVTVPIEDFRLNEAVTPTYRSYVRGVEIEAAPGDAADGDTDSLLLDDVRLQRGNPVGLDTPVQSKPGTPGDTIEYEVTVFNSSDEPQPVSLRLDRDGGEVIVTEVDPEEVHLGPLETATVTVTAEVPTYDDPGFQGELPEGGRERWRLTAVPDGQGDLAAEIELIHVVQMEPPYIVHTETEWDEIRELVETEDWAAEQAEEHVSFARDYEPPAPAGATSDSVYDSNVPSKDMWRVAVTWQLTREDEFAEKAADFLRDVVDPEHGYPATLDASGGHGGTVKEGTFFKNVARIYDAVRDSGVLSEEDRRQVEATLRLYMEWCRESVGGAGNHPLSAIRGAVFCALVLQDWERVERFLAGPCGVEWQLRRGVMDDGWSIEVSTGYSMFVARMLTNVGLALRHWGVEVIENRYPAVYHESVETSARPGESAGPWGDPAGGMYGAVWGPSERNYRSVRDMYDSVIPLITETDGVVGINDAHGEGGNLASTFDVAAYAFGEDRYRRIASGERLLYPVDRSGVEEMDDDLLPNGRADNAGVAMLRSQGADSARDQYQAALKYGSHGLHHGHWDRLNLVHLRRFGKMATHTRTAWFSYHNFMYQMYVQTSMAHSMVVVDGKNQYPAPSDRLLWHEGDQFQATAVENESEWSTPRFRSDFASEEVRDEGGIMEHDTGIEVEIPEDAPEPGSMTDFTEPIRSRRAVAVTDDYVLVFDHVAGEEEHRFDALYQFRGFEEFADGDDVAFVEEQETFDEGPYLAGQFVSDVKIYDAEGSVRATFVSGYEPGEPEPQPEVEEGMETMTIDVHTAWPPEREHVVSTNPQDWNTYSAGRTRGREASFVTLLELQEDKEDRQVEAVTAERSERVRVELADGRVHRWQVSGLEVGESRPAVDVHLTEEGADGSRSEETTGTQD